MSDESPVRFFLTYIQYTFTSALAGGPDLRSLHLRHVTHITQTFQFFACVFARAVLVSVVAP